MKKFMKKWIGLVTAACMLVTMSPFAIDELGGNGSVAAAPKYKLTGDQAADVVGLAKSCQGMTLAQTKKRLSSYGKRLYSPNYPGEWCAWFVSNCAQVAGVPKGIITRNNTAGPNAGFHKWAVKNKLFRSTKYTPKPGDLALYYGSGLKHGHIEIVASVSKKGVVKTISGNSGKAHWSKSKVAGPRNRGSLTGYIKINYSKKKTPPSTSTPFNHNIAFDLNGGSGTIKSFNVMDNANFSIPAARPTRPAYTFRGWYAKRRADNPQKWYAGEKGWCTWDTIIRNNYAPRLYQPGEKHIMNASWTTGCPKSDYMFVAQWSFNHKLDFDLNGGSGTFNRIVVGDNANFTIPTAKPTRPGYSFRGWYVKRRADNPQKWHAGEKGWCTWDAIVLNNYAPRLYLPGEKHCMNVGWTTGCAASDYMFYAQWDPIGYAHTVSFNNNGGNGVGYTYQVKDGEKIPFPTANPTRDGYAFTGWYCNRVADNTWHVQDIGWLTWNNLTAKKYTPRLYKSNEYHVMRDSWLQGNERSNYIFYAQWKKL